MSITEDFDENEYREVFGLENKAEKETKKADDVSPAEEKENINKTDTVTEEPEEAAKEETAEEKITEFEDISSNSEEASEEEETESAEEESGETPEEASQEEQSEEETKPEKQKGRFGNWLWRNKRHRAKLFFVILSCAILVFGTAYGLINGAFDQMHEPEAGQTTKKKPVDDKEPEVIYDEEDYELFQAVQNAGSLNDYVYQWYHSGSPMYSRNVINVVLLGLDSFDGLKNGGRSDTMMLVSLNRKTKKIKMVSFFRDTWAYWQSETGAGYYGKMNGAYNTGGANCTMRTLENMFKIKIDHYVATDFRAFWKLVNAVGGVRVDVQEYEARNLYREWQIEVDYGEDILLNGQQALYFARQRHSDSDADVSRTRRQRQVIAAFIESCKGASLSQLTDALNAIFGYIKTDLTKTDIINYATKALAYGWTKYDIESIQISDPSIFRTPTINGQSIVVQDYPKVAQIVQEAIYGETNIVSGGVSPFNLYH